MSEGRMGSKAGFTESRWLLCEHRVLAMGTGDAVAGSREQDNVTDSRTCGSTCPARLCAQRVLSTFVILTHAYLSVTLSAVHDHHLHFTGEGTEDQRGQGHPRPQSWQVSGLEANPGNLAPNSTSHLSLHSLEAHCKRSPPLSQ